jgi:hypothetical protein
MVLRWRLKESTGYYPGMMWPPLKYRRVRPTASGFERVDTK